MAGGLLGSEYVWTWGKSYHYTKEQEPERVPAETDARESCPASLPDGADWVTLGTASHCLVPLGEFVKADANAIELGEVTLYRSKVACERTRVAGLAMRVPSCSERPRDTQGSR